MAIQLVQGPTAYYNNNTTTTTGNFAGTTAGNMLVFVSHHYASASNVPDLSSIAIAGESNATLIAASKYSDNANTGEQFQVSYLSPLASGGTKAITGTLSAAGYLQLIVYEISGQAAGDPYNIANVGHNFSASTAVSFTTTVDNCAAFVGCSAGTAKCTVAGAGYVSDTVVYTDIWSFDAGEHCLDVGPAGVKSAEMTIPTPPQSWVLTVAAFAPSTAPPPFQGNRIVLVGSSGVWI